MPELHLPASHQTQDLLLAHRIADAVESAELYVVWSHEAGAGQIPEVRARVREEPHVVVEAVASIFNWIAAAISFLAPARQQAEATPPAGPATPDRPQLHPPEAA